MLTCCAVLKIVEWLSRLPAFMSQSIYQLQVGTYDNLIMVHKFSRAFLTSLAIHRWLGSVVVRASDL